MEIATILGLLVGVGGILIGNLIEGGHVDSLIQGAAFLIVVGGTIGSVLVSSKMDDVKAGLTLFLAAFQEKDQTAAKNAIVEVVECAKIAKKESLVALEARVNKISDKFMANILKSVVDGVDGKIIRDVFEQEISLEEEKLMNAAKVWSDAGGFSPTIGIIGAVLGLIHVMGNLTDTSKLGAGIATAFVATIYGVGFANLIFLPISNKLKKIIADRMREKEMVLEGSLCVQQGLSPHLVEVRMQSFLKNS